jgi:hypothetical protein
MNRFWDYTFILLFLLVMGLAVFAFMRLKTPFSGNAFPPASEQLNSAVKS